MNPAYFGDSYDLVKRFFCSEVSALGYKVLIEPMLTGEWLGAEAQFFKLVGATPSSRRSSPAQETALLVDPDTGVHSKAGGRHVSIHQLVALAKQHALVFAFDQSFSRQAKYADAMLAKLASIQELGAHAMYYNSHARFVFVAETPEPLAALREHLMRIGLPSHRLVAASSNPSIERTD